MRLPILCAILFLLGGCSLVGESSRSWPLDTGGDPIAASGESYVALSGDTCPGACPVYAILVFESGRVVFVGKQNTRRPGVVERQTTTAAYYDLQKLLLVHRAFSRRFHVGCRSGRAGFSVGAVQGERQRVGYLNYGCFNQIDDLDAITAAFIRVADAKDLIGTP